MQRRGFLRLLGLGSAAAIVLPSMPFEWTTDVAVAHEPIIGNTFAWIVQDLARALGDRYGAVTLRDGSMLGQEDLQHLFGLDLAPLQSFDGLTVTEARERFIEPTIACLEQQFAHLPSACGQLDLPKCCEQVYRATDLKRGWSVRGVQAYDPVEGRTLTRFDVLTN
jgi:hypothetical protein